MATPKQAVAPGPDTTEWHAARLIPTVGIRGQEEQERRATSSLLAVMRAVPEFGHALLKELGAPKSPIIDTFAEVRFKDAAGKTVIPDGAIVCRRGQRVWTCLVEVKTAGAPLLLNQVSSYLEIAKDNGFDGVLTISNQITPTHMEREPRSFVISLGRPMGQKRGKAEGSFVRETRAQTFDFYRDIVQRLKVWQARPPKLRESEEPVATAPSPEPPSFADADIREVGDAADPLAEPEVGKRLSG